MFAKSILTAAAVVGAATAQTGPGFPVPASQPLVVSFENNTVSPAGELIPRPGMYSCQLYEKYTPDCDQKRQTLPMSASPHGTRPLKATTRPASSLS